MGDPSAPEVTLRPYRADLHLHSCLSPCAGMDMRPTTIVEVSLRRGLDIIAVCDHNSAENAGAVLRSGQERGLVVIPGMEICSREEVHVLALFESLEQALAMQEFVYAHLPGTNKPRIFGDQLVVDERDRVIRENPRLLIMATRLLLREIVDQTHRLEGLSVASHIDRPAYGIIRKLGFIPGDLPLDGVEISRRLSVANARERLGAFVGSRPCITSSDAHVPDDIGKAWTSFWLASPRLSEVRMALEGRNRRRIGV